MSTSTRGNETRPPARSFSSSPLRLTLVPDNRLYRLHVNGEPVDGYGPYEDEEVLIDALVDINRSTHLEWGDLLVHVYETDATPLGIGRKYLGSIDGSTILMMGEVDEDRVTSSS